MLTADIDISDWLINSQIYIFDGDKAEQNMTNNSINQCAYKKTK